MKTILFLIGMALIFYFAFFYEARRPTPKTTSVSEPAVRAKVSRLDVRVFFGYKDARPARFVADRYEAEVLIQLLTSKCKGGLAACEFEKDLDGGEVERLYKVITLKDGEKRKVSVRIFTSSATPDDEANRKNPFQQWKSNFVRGQFVEALQSADVIFYNGHSRAGGGPDFFPPVLTKSKHVNYRYFQKNTPGLSLIQQTLKGTKNSRLKVIGMFSCQSDQLFRNKIAASKPSIEVLGSRQLLYFSDALNQSSQELSRIMLDSKYQ